MIVINKELNEFTMDTGVVNGNQVNNYVKCGERGTSS